MALALEGDADGAEVTGSAFVPSGAVGNGMVKATPTEAPGQRRRAASTCAGAVQGMMEERNACCSYGIT